MKQAELHPSTARPPHARVLTVDGHWLDIHAARLLGPELGHIAVVIEPAQRQSMAVLLLSAYGLTEREREIAVLVLRGESTRSITASLHISGDTVQDHLKAVFDKTGTRSRRDLVGLFLA